MKNKSLTVVCPARARSTNWLLTGVAWYCLFSGADFSLAQGSAFTYQGRLSAAGGSANGIYDLRLAIYDAAAGGAQQGAALTNAAIAVSNGLFTVTLDFGNQFPGANRWLEIGVRTNGGGAFATLSPRQQLTPTPYAIHAANASNAAVAASVAAANITGTIPLGQLPATLITNRASGVNISGTFSGSGAGITNLELTALQRSISSVVIWGSNGYGQTNLPGGLSNVLAIAAGAKHSLALKSDRTVFAWGLNLDGQTNIPVGLNNVVAIAGGESHSLAVRSDGTVVGWGANANGQTNIPVGLNGVVAIAGGLGHSLALKSDGTVVGWGYNVFGQATVPVGLSSVVAIAAGVYHSLAVKSDGTVVAWGWNGNGQIGIPVGLSNVVAVSGGANHSLALKSDGTVVAWGDNGTGQSTIPAGLNGVVAIAAGNNHNLALKSDGTVVGWGSDGSGQSIIPGGLNGVVAIAGGETHSVAIRKISSPAQLALLNANQTFTGLNTFSQSLTLASAQELFFADLGQIRSLDNAHRIIFRRNENKLELREFGDLIFSPGATAGTETAKVVMLAGGNVGIGTNNPQQALHVVGNILASGTVTGSSDRNVKRDFTPVDTRAVLDKVAALPISSWAYIADDGVRHLGPMAQDFYAAFQVGQDDTHISMVDADGVALAAIQGLNQKLNGELKRKDTEIAELKRRLEKLEELINETNGGVR